MPTSLSAQTPSPITRRVVDFDWNPDGQELVFAYTNGEVWLYDMQTQTESLLYAGSYIQSVRFSPDGHKITLGDLAEATIIDSNSGSVLSHLQKPPDAETVARTYDSVREVRWSPDGNLLAIRVEIGLQFYIHIWEIATQTRIDYFQVGYGSNMEWSPDGAWLAIALGYYYPVLYNITQPRELTTFVEIEALSRDVVWSPDGSQLAIGNEDEVQIWDFASRTLVQSTELPPLTPPGVFKGVTSLDWNLDGRYIAIGARAEADLYVWDIVEDRIVYSIDLPTVLPSQVKWSPDGSQLAYAVEQNENPLVIIPVSLFVPPTSTPTPTSVPTETPTFTPTFTATPSPTPTFTLTVTPAFQRLRLTALCSPDPNTLRRWRVRNTNGYEVAFTWDVYRTPQTGSGIVVANGDTMFETQTVPNSTNTVRIFVNGVQQDVKASNPNVCP